jgi:hypothetical protein
MESYNLDTVFQFLSIHGYWQFSFLSITRGIRLFFGKKRRKESKLTHIHKFPSLWCWLNLIALVLNFIILEELNLKMYLWTMEPLFSTKRQWLCWAFNWLSDLRLPVWRVNFGSRNLALNPVLQLARMWINFLLKGRHIFSKKERNKTLNLITLLLSAFPQPPLTFFESVYKYQREMFLNVQIRRKETRQLLLLSNPHSQRFILCEIPMPRVWFSF